MQTLLNKIELILDIAILILLIFGLVVLAVLAIQNGVRDSADATAESVEETPAETLPEVETTELAEETVAETSKSFDIFSKYDSRSQYYALATTIVEFDWENDIVTCEDDMGFRWQFEGIEDWCIGDTATLVMYTNGTDLIYDDVIIRATYSTWELKGGIGND